MQRTILVADDSPTIRRLVTQTFADGNFRIVEVNNGDAAIRTFDEVQPSVVLADIYMPGKNGYQVCTYIRTHPDFGQTPVVLLVGAFDAFDEDAAKKAGATASITKPFEPGALIDLVTSVLQPEEGEAAPEREAVVETLGENGQARGDGPARSQTVPTVEPAAGPESEDLLGLATIFKEESVASDIAGLSEKDIDRIADRVIQRISTQLIESIAWDVVPDITEKIIREELKRINEG
jgi:CheY-like chemotaxis protein